MIAPPRMAKRPGTPTQFRTLLVIFIIRHLLSVGLFGYLTYLSWLIPGPFRFIMLAISLGFVSYAAYSGTKIFGMYRRSRRAADAMAGK